jgi:hypothetical protein
VDDVGGGRGELAPLRGDHRREEVDHGARSDEHECIKDKEALAREELGVPVQVLVLELGLKQAENKREYITARYM